MERLTTKYGGGLYESVNPIDIYDNEYSKVNYHELTKRLGEYEDLEEQGKLLKLPCAVGDTVYAIEKSQTGRYMIYQMTADRFHCAIWMLSGKFGKCIFPTYEEAETALGEL